MNGLLTHEKIQSLHFNNGKLDDKSGNMLSRLITRQSQRRDQVIWMYGLRNERPLNNEYAQGLVLIDFSNNMLGDESAEAISYALSSDNYIRKINLSNNNLSELGCKKFSQLLKTNDCIVNIDLRGNPGFSESINLKITARLAGNIRKLFSINREEANEAQKYIDFSMFKTELPEHIAELYNRRQTNHSERSKSNNPGRKHSEKSANIEINNQKFINNSHINGVNGNGNGSDLNDLTSNKQITMNSNLSKTGNLKEINEMIDIKTNDAVKVIIF